MSCLKSCLKRSCYKKSLTFFYKESLRGNNCENKPRFLLAATSQTDDCDSIISDTTTNYTSITTASTISTFQPYTPNTYREQEIATNYVSKSTVRIDNFINSFVALKNTSKSPLSILQLIIHSIIHSLNAQIFVVSGFAAYKYGGTSIVVSYILCTVSTIITGLCLSEFTSRVPTRKRLSIYQYIYITNGELFAYLIGINSILYSLILLSMNCIIFSGYFESFLKSINLLKQTDIDNDVSLQYLFGKSFNSVINIHFIPSLCAAIIVMIFVKARQNNKIKHDHYHKVICCSFNIFVILSFILITIISLSLIYYYEIPSLWLKPCDNSNCPTNAKNSFLPFGIKGFFACCAINTLCFDAIFCLSKFTNYRLSSRPQKIITHSIIWTTIINAVVYILLLLSLLSLIPFQSINILSTYSSLFNKKQTVFATLFSISIALLIIYFQMLKINKVPFLINDLINDGLLPVHVLCINELILFAISYIIISSIFEVQLLIELVSIITLISNTLICSSILILRYSQPIHAKYHAKLKEKYEQTETTAAETMDFIDRQIYEMNLNREKSRQWKHGSILLLVWFYIIIILLICILLFCYDKIILFHLNLWTFSFTFLCMVVLYFSGVFVYLHHTLNWKLWISPLENNNNPIFLTPLCPYIPLFGIILNCLMIASIVNIVAAMALIKIYCVAIVSYYLYGFHKSKLYQQSKKQYLLDGVKFKSNISSMLGNHYGNHYITKLENEHKYDVE